MSRRQTTEKARRPRKSGQDTPDIGAFAHLPPADRNLAESVQNALDREDYAATLKAAGKALNSTNAEVRLHAVEALGWFGKRALAELTPCMADSDENVAQSAANAWELALSEIEDAKERFDVALLALTTISAKDPLRMIGSQFANAATDLIEGIEDEQSAAEKRIGVVQAVADIICGDQPSQAAAAREIYEEITGHEWLNVEEAEKYLSDPENYEPPENTEAP